ncbi:MAG TPA: N-acetylneuraminate synthase family protein [Kofleriaceae bacterium]|nr:N-acetylneuraminate synthase family protein [Kofleriaceae bacterium]
MASFSIAGRAVGPEHPCFVIAEVAQAHDGSLGAAHAYIDAAARAGASAIKFQTHIAAAESAPDEPWRVKFSPQDATRYQYWQRMEFPEAAWAGLLAHASERGLVFLSSPFSLEAVALLDRIGVPAWKVASGEVDTGPLLEAMAATAKPLLFSSGMSSFAALDGAIDIAHKAGCPVAALQCTSAYPCPPDKVGLNVIGQLRDRYRCPVGLSDHSGTIFAGLAAAALGADLLEVHIAFSREQFGPDTAASITIDELAELCRGAAFIRQALAHPVDKEAVARELAPLRALFGKSIVSARALAAGSRLGHDDVTLKKPGTGLPAADLERIIGRTLARDIAADQRLTEDDLV